MGYKTEKLLEERPYSFDGSGKMRGGLFYDALMEELCFHYDNNEKYRRFCGRKGFDPHSFDGEISEIPPVQVSVFKAMGRELRSVPQDEIRLTLQSSATSGTPSSVLVDRITAKRQARAMVHVIGDYLGNQRLPFLVMDVDPASGFRQLLGARFAAVSGYLNFASKAEYFLMVDERKRYYFDIEGIRDYIAGLDPDTPVVVFGFTYILYAEVIRPMFRQDIRFQLPEGSKMIHIGGWKKLESEKVGREEFNEEAASVFGIPGENVIDIYGFTEQMGLNYPTCPCGCKHAPAYAEVLVRDVGTKRILGDGQEGLLEFVTPVPHSYPGNAVLTDDMGRIEKGPCPYGRTGTRFHVSGRLKKAEIRGCGDILSSKLTFTGDKDEKHAEAVSGYRVDYFYPDTGLAGMEPHDSLNTIMDHLMENMEWLRRQPVDALIGLIAKVAEKWGSDQTETFRRLRNAGGGFLASWCRPEHLSNLVTEALHGNRMHMDAFLPVSEKSIQYRKAVPRGLCCHWLAGNVQVLGMFVLIESILTKNVNLLKVSSRDDGVFSALLQAFKDEEYVTPGGFRIAGNDLLKTIAVVYYGHTEKELGQLMSARADIRVAWGGAEAVNTVANYPAKYDCESLIMGPKLSFAVVSRESLDNERKAKKLGRRIGVDASVFDQTGCASAHNVFVETGGAVSPEQFAGFLADGMKRAASYIPREASSAEQAAAVHSVRGIYDFKGTVYGDEDAGWSVLYDPDAELCRPVYSRAIFVHPVTDIMEAVRFVDGNIQTVGMAAEGEKALAFAAAAAEKGAVRFPACGRMLNFDSPWDGMYLADRMVRWVTVGGPEV